MLLQHLNDFAQSRNLLDNLAFKPKAVRWIITLDGSGNLIGNGPVETEGERPRRGQVFSCPQTTRPKVAGGVAEFLAEGITAVFGLDTEPEKSMTEEKRDARDANNLSKFQDFWDQIERATITAGNAALKGLQKFKPNPGETPAFLRWGKSATPRLQEKSAWWITKTDGKEVKMGPDNLTFRVDDTFLLEDETHIRPFWRDAFDKENTSAETDAPRGLCLVSGETDQPIALTHNPKVQGVPNTQSFGAAICSFDKDPFVSFGLEQSLNASTSIRASTGYCTALNAMLGSDDHSIRLGQACCCFWTRKDTGATSGWGDLLNQADPKAVADFLKSPWAGQERERLSSEDFFAVTLAGNSGRIVVRHWFQAALEQAAANLQQWFADLDLVPVKLPGGNETWPALALFRLACTTVRDQKELQPDTTEQLFRAALEGVSPALTLLHPMLNRLRVDTARDGASAMLNHSRFALTKLILNRNKKQNIMTIETHQTSDTQDAAYQCGRLLAVLAEAQAKAHDYKLEGAGVTERYFGTAMSSPASVFPLIIKLNRHHLVKIGKSDKFRGHERFLDEAIQEVLTKFDHFPRTLDLHSQGRFAIGFYQQKAADRVAREAHKAKKKESDNK
ncbi:type I-C CRISPR-associated protein Cas8c/Csd1 [bacterium]|nr:type I-C CRISPR-associated protein Cas8c/Csd1 [bacterium]